MVCLAVQCYCLLLQKTYWKLAFDDSEYTRVVQDSPGTRPGCRGVGGGKTTSYHQSHECTQKGRHKYGRRSSKGRVAIAIHLGPFLRPQPLFGGGVSGPTRPRKFFYISFCYQKT